MPRYPETQALLEQALLHVLDEQDKLFKREDCAGLTEILVSLNALALKTTKLLTGGLNNVSSVSSLVANAKRTEGRTDEISELLWTHIPVSVSAIYERIENSIQRRTGRPGLVADTRAHYHNLHVRLLNQMLGARMLILNSDLGQEHESIWQQFLERHLGPAFKVLQGGHVFDHEGNRSECQVDLIVLPADAQVFVPGDTKGGKAFVLVDQVISVIMVTSNLTKEKMESEWRKLQTLPRYPNMEADFPQLKDHPWPLCYVVSAQSDTPEELKETWEKLAGLELTKVVPQFVIALDTGFLYCGLRRWPCPRWPGNYVGAGDVHFEGGIYGGLGLAWLIAQHQGRLAVIQQRGLGQITRFARLLDAAMVRDEGVPATYSPRFQTFMQMRSISGAFAWGNSACFAHNKLQLRSLQRHPQEGRSIYETELFQEGTDTSRLEFGTFHHSLRWFRYASTHIVGDHIAFEEWINPRSKTEHRRKIAVFNLTSGQEIKGPRIDALEQVVGLDTIRPHI